jgi:hypothetical protein
MAYLYSEFVKLDLKLENIFVLKDPFTNRLVVKIGDFDFAKINEHEMNYKWYKINKILMNLTLQICFIM